MNKRAVVLLSGGMDSSTLLWDLVKNGWETKALTVFYGQRHEAEIDSANKIASLLGVPHKEVDLGTLQPLLTGSSQTDWNVEVPVGHYEDPVMKLTVVPNRNMILLAVAAAYAISSKMHTVAYAAHSGDHAVYPDCRPEFITALSGALKLCHYDGGVELFAPYSNITKAGIVDIGMALKVPYRYTYSCYTGEPTHCGKCGTCVERRLAFDERGYSDPVSYLCTLEETKAVAGK